MLRLARQYGTLIGFVAIFVLFWVSLPDTFVTSRNLMNITQQVSMLAVVSFTMTIVMAMGDFDLSVGSMASLAGIVAAKAFVAGLSPWLAIPCALAVGVVGGLANGVLVAYVGIMPFIATLGTLTLFSGLAFRISDGKTIFGSAIPSSFSGFARGGLQLWSGAAAIPNLTLVAIAALVLTWTFLEHTIHGRRLYAIGGNAEAALLAGIRIRPLRCVAFGLSGFGAAVAGLMISSRVASANPTQGASLMLDAIAAVFLGTTMSDEGQPRVLFTLMGVLMLGVLGNGLTQMNVDSYVREMITGAIIIVAVGAGSLGRLRTGQ
jgi:ribose transport system permease protein